MFRIRDIAKIVAVIAFPSIAFADATQTTEVDQIVAQISKLHHSLAGKTLTMKGALGTFVGEAIYFKNDNGMFEVQFDAGRAARKKIEGCQLDWFVWSKSKCLFDVDAEISISEAFSLAEGGKITLIIYDIRE